MHANIPYMDPMGPWIQVHLQLVPTKTDRDRYQVTVAQKKFFQPSSFMDSGCLCLRGGSYTLLVTLQGTNTFHLGNRKIIFKMPFLGDMLVLGSVIR